VAGLSHLSGEFGGKSVAKSTIAKRTQTDQTDEKTPGNGLADTEGSLVPLISSSTGCPPGERQPLLVCSPHDLLLPVSTIWPSRASLCRKQDNRDVETGLAKVQADGKTFLKTGA